MSYTFTGFIIPDLTIPKKMGFPIIVKSIVEPINASIIYIDKDNEEISYKDVLARFEIPESTTWLYLYYSTWAGRIDYVSGIIKIEGGEEVCSNAVDEEAEELFTSLMAKIGINENDAYNFAPFSRDYFVKQCW